MKIKNEIVDGVFVKRINRFEAFVKINDREELVHVPNTGRCRELLVEGASVRLEVRKSAKRKTAYELVLVYKGNKPVSIDSQLPNKLVEEALANGTIKEISGYGVIKREKTYGDSRFDFFLSQSEAAQDCFIEVKGVTLEVDNIAMFPDAPTERGTKHVYELIHAKLAGYRAAILFVLQFDFVELFTPNRIMDEAFTKALEEALAAGVEVYCYDCSIEESNISLRHRVPFELYK